MLLSDKELGQLETLVDKSIKDGSVGDDLWLLLHTLTTRVLLSNKRYAAFGDDFVEDSTIKCMERLLKYTPKYSDDRGAKAREDRGLPANRQRAIHAYLNRVIISTIFNCISTFLKRQERENNSKDGIRYLRHEMGLTHYTELDDLIDITSMEQFEESDQSIDNYWMEKRTGVSINTLNKIDELHDKEQLKIAKNANRSNSSKLKKAK